MNEVKESLQFLGLCVITVFLLAVLYLEPKLIVYAIGTIIVSIWTAAAIKYLRKG